MPTDRVISSAEVMKLPPGSGIIHQHPQCNVGVVVVGEGPFLRDRRNAQIPIADLLPDSKWEVVYENTPQT